VGHTHFFTGGIWWWALANSSRIPNLKSLASSITEIYGNLFLNNKFAFWATLWGVRGNVRTSSIAHCKVRSWVPIRDNWTFSLALIADALIRRNWLCWYWSKSALFRGGWVTLSANFRWKGTSPPPPTIVGIRKLECFCYLTVKTAWSSLYSPACDGQTDGRTDGISVGITALCIANNATAL